MTGFNYEVAWSILDNRFNNIRWLIEENINSIIDAFPVEGKSASSFLKYIHTYSSAIHNLTDLDVKKSSEILIVIIMKKLDEYTKSRFEDSLDKNFKMNRHLKEKTILIFNTNMKNLTK